MREPKVGDWIRRSDWDKCPVDKYWEVCRVDLDGNRLWVLNFAGEECAYRIDPDEKEVFWVFHDHIFNQSLIDSEYYQAITENS